MFTLSPDILATEYDMFWEQGFVIVRGVFTRDEMAHVKTAIASNNMMTNHIEDVRSSAPDGKHGAFNTLKVWNDTGGNDIFAKVTRNYKILDRLRHFFNDDVYVYHNKVALKYPGIRGFQYHQDYAYWYDMGCLWPDMATAQIALEDSTVENGCLRVLAGTHKLGRVNHTYDETVKDTGVDKKRLAMLKPYFKEVVAELAAGDVIIFHCNIFHASYDNNSDKSRIALLGCYNTKHNNPAFATEHGHPFYYHQPSLDEAITAADINNLPDFNMKFTPEVAKLPPVGMM